MIGGKQFVFTTCAQSLSRKNITCLSRLNVLHSVAFAVVLSVTAYVIIDLEYPRLGFIQISDSDQVLVDLRKSMN